MAIFHGYVSHNQRVYHTELYPKISIDDTSIIIGEKSQFLCPKNIHSCLYIPHPDHPGTWMVKLQLTLPALLATDHEGRNLRQLLPKKAHPEGFLPEKKAIMKNSHCVTIKYPLHK